MKRIHQVEVHQLVNKIVRIEGGLLNGTFDGQDKANYQLDSDALGADNLTFDGEITKKKARQHLF